MLYFVVITLHDDVIKWNHFPRYWPFVRGIHRSPVNSPHKGQWRGALMFSLICAWINAWVNTREAGDLRRHRAHYVIVMIDFVVSCNIFIHMFQGFLTGTELFHWNVTLILHGYFTLRGIVKSKYTYLSITCISTEPWAKRCIGKHGTNGPVLDGLLWK